MSHRWTSVVAVTVETARLRLRPCRDGDAARLYDMYRREEVVRWVGTPVLRDPAEGIARARYFRRRHAEADPPCGLWALERRDTGLVVGVGLVKVLPRTDGATGTDVEIGWHLHPDSWGHGYATEAGRWLRDHALAAGLAEVFAVVHPDNAASAAVARRLGMTPLGSTGEWYGETLLCFRVRRADPPHSTAGQSPTGAAADSRGGATV